MNIGSAATEWASISADFHCDHVKGKAFLIYRNGALVGSTSGATSPVAASSAI